MFQKIRAFPLALLALAAAARLSAASGHPYRETGAEIAAAQGAADRIQGPRPAPPRFSRPLAAPRRAAGGLVRGRGSLHGRVRIRIGRPSRPAGAPVARRQLSRREPLGLELVSAGHDGCRRPLAVSRRRQRAPAHLRQDERPDRRRAQCRHGRLLRRDSKRRTDLLAARALRPALRRVDRHRPDLRHLPRRQPRPDRLLRRRHDLAGDDLDVLLFRARPRCAGGRRGALLRRRNARRGRQRPGHRRKPLRWTDRRFHGHDRSTSSARARSFRAAEETSPPPRASWRIETSRALPTAPGPTRRRVSTTSPTPQRPSPGSSASTTFFP